MSNIRIYWSAELFTEAQREWNEKCKKELEMIKGVSVYLPQSKHQTSKEHFHDNIKELEKANIIIFVVNGSDPDSGVAWEAGYSYGKNTQKHRWILRDDYRKSGDFDDVICNLMLHHSSDKVFMHISEIKEELIHLLYPDCKNITEFYNVNFVS